MVQFLMVISTLTVFFVSLFVAFTINIDKQGLGFAGSPIVWAGYFATCASMFLGIFFGSLYRSLSLVNGEMSIVTEASRVLKTAAFWRAICVAPLVFMGLYATTSGVPGDLPSILLAFQNGFFWENILKRTEASV